MLPFVISIKLSGFQDNPLWLVIGHHLEKGKKTVYVGLIYKLSSANMTLLHTCWNSFSFLPRAVDETFPLAFLRSLFPTVVLVLLQHSE